MISLNEDNTKYKVICNDCENFVEYPAYLDYWTLSERLKEDGWDWIRGECQWVNSCPNCNEDKKRRNK